jgi:hypothetical protein
MIIGRIRHPPGSFPRMNFVSQSDRTPTNRHQVFIIPCHGIAAQLPTEKMSIAQVMPQDIICEIFAYVWNYWHLDANEPKFFPWYLCHICSQWRTTLLSMGPHKLYVSSSEGDIWMGRESSFEIANVVTHFLELNRGRQFDLNLRFNCYLHEFTWCWESSCAG